MKKLLAIVALGVAASLANTPAFALDDQAAGATTRAAAGGRGGFFGTRAEVGATPIAHPRYSGALDSVDSPPVWGGSELIYAPDRPPYASEGGPTRDFQLEGR